MTTPGDVRSFAHTGTNSGLPSAVPEVRIHSAPPHSLACFPTLWRSDEIGGWGAIHARPWTRRMPTAAAERENRLKFSVRDFGMSICEPADILRRSVLEKTLPDASNYTRVSLSGFQSLLLRTPERGEFDSLGHR